MGTQRTYRLPEGWTGDGGLEAQARFNNAVAKLLNNFAVTGGGDLQVKQDRLLLNVRPAGSSPAYPFQVRNKTDGTQGAVSVVFGTVNDVTPTIDHRSLGTGYGLDETVDEVGPPEYSGPPLLYVSGDGVIYLACSVDGSDVSSAEVLYGASLPADDEDTKHVLIASVTLDTTTDPEHYKLGIYQAVSHSLRYRLCGADALFWAV